MSVNKALYETIKNECSAANVMLVAVSKTKGVADIMELYNLGQRDFGENYVQELVTKYEQLPKDIRWHFIGHLQRNKVKYIVPFVYLIQSVDSERLLAEIDKQSQTIATQTKVLLQVHIADEATKFGFDGSAIKTINPTQYPNTSIHGLMGMASFTDNLQQVQTEFHQLHSLFKNELSKFSEKKYLCMGMSADYKIAIQEGANMIRIGSLLFGKR